MSNNFKNEEKIAVSENLLKICEYGEKYKKTNFKGFYF